MISFSDEHNETLCQNTISFQNMKKKLVLLLSKPGLLFLLLNVWIIKGDQISWGKLEKHFG